jgi:hypothetical protein
MKKIALYLLAFVSLATASYAQKTATINVGSYNLRYNTPNDGVNAWPNRKENVKGLVRFHEFDIFGVQEALVGQLKDVAELPEFTYYGKGRDDGKEGRRAFGHLLQKRPFQTTEIGRFLAE